MTLGLRHSEMFERDGLDSVVSLFEGWACKEETGERLDSVKAVLVKGAHFKALTCSFVLTAVFPF